MVATAERSSATTAGKMFQSLSGFLMVATGADHELAEPPAVVSIPIGFSNGCNCLEE